MQLLKKFWEQFEKEFTHQKQEQNKSLSNKANKSIMILYLFIYLLFVSIWVQTQELGDESGNNGLYDSSTSELEPIGTKALWFLVSHSIAENSYFPIW